MKCLHREVVDYKAQPEDKKYTEQDMCDRSIVAHWDGYSS